MRREYSEWRNGINAMFLLSVVVTSVGGAVFLPGMVAWQRIVWFLLVFIPGGAGIMFLENFFKGRQHPGPLMNWCEKHGWPMPPRFPMPYPAGVWDYKYDKDELAQHNMEYFPWKKAITPRMIEHGAKRCPKCPMLVGLSFGSSPEDWTIG